MTAPVIVRIVSADDIRHGPFAGWVDVVRAAIPTLPAPATEGGGYQISAPPVVARVNPGRWIADCPSEWCNGAEYVGPQENLFWCGSCGEGVHRVRFPQNKADIEAVLSARPHADFASWEPGMSLEELRTAGSFHRSWTTPRTWVTAEIVTASVGNTHWRDDLNETAPAKAAAAGDLFHGTAANAIAALGIGTALQVLRVNAGATAPEWGAATIEAAAQAFIEEGTHRSFAALGAVNNGVAYINDLAVGLGFAVVETDTAQVQVTISGTGEGMWNLSTGTTTGTDAGLRSTIGLPAGDPTFVARVILETEAGASIIIGFSPSVGVFDDANGIIAFRVAGTGDIIGVSDNGGTETTRDTTVTPDGTSQHTLRVEISSGATVVKFFRNDAQVGADVTTNIPSAAVQAQVGISCTGTDHDMWVADAFSWREV